MTGTGRLFDFERWCSWIEARCQQAGARHVTIEFRRGQPSPKQGGVVFFKTDQKLMQLAFWQTGEADFFGIELSTGSDIVGFIGRVLDDRSFEQAFGECLSTVS